MKRTSLCFFVLLIVLLLGISVTGCSTKPEKANTPAASPLAPAETPKTSEQSLQEPNQLEVISGLIAQGQKITELSYEMVMIGGGLSSESQVWFKEKRMKADTVFNGQRLISLFDYTKDEVISYLPGDQAATKTKLAEYQGQDSMTPLSYTLDLDKADFRPLGKETVNGMECQVINIISVDGSYKEWLSIDHGLVVKVEGDFGGQGMTIEFKNIKAGPGSVPENTFDLPKGIEVIDFNAMMQDLPETKNP